jgi:hypothetical protein
MPPESPPKADRNPSQETALSLPLCVGHGSRQSTDVAHIALNETCKIRFLDTTCRVPAFYFFSS